MLPRIRTAAFIAPIAVALLVVACREITAPDRAQQRSGAAKQLLNPSGTVVVYPDSMRGWVFYNDQTNAVCPTGTACRMVQGPMTPPLGTGSAELYDSLASDGKALILPDYAGTRFDQITDLQYATFRQTTDAGNNLAISLQFNVDYDLSDAATGYQGRLVFEPYVGIGGNVPQNTWQTWDAKAGKWWGTRATVTRNGASVTNPCVQATPCTWAQVLAAFPNVGVHGLYGAVVLKAGSGWAGFRGNVDQLKIGVGEQSTTFDFESVAPISVPATAPASPPYGLLQPSRLLPAPDSLKVPVFADLIEVRFVPGTTVAERSAAIGSVGGTVVGGFSGVGAEGIYSVLLPADPTGATMLHAVRALRTRASVAVARVEWAVRGGLAYRRTNEGVGLSTSDWILNPNDAFAGPSAPWAASAVAAPFAWGCADGEGVTAGVLDMGLASNPEMAGHTDSLSILRPAERGFPLAHGQWVASVLGATADNGVGVAGIAPKARLLLADISIPDTATGRIVVDSSGAATTSVGMFANAWAALSRSQPRVVNISLGAEVAPTHEMDSTYRDLVSQLKEDISHRAGWDPLFIVAAGNAGLIGGRHDWGVFGSLRDSMPARVLIVGAADKTRHQRASFTSASGIVDIYAPGVQVAVYDSLGGRDSQDGTSFAAPLVSGSATLLFSFDPRLTSADVRALLLSGADTARAVDGVAFLDAYGSLKLAGSRPGAALCGNRAWRSGDSLLVRRGDSTEALSTNLGPSTGDLELYHGGRRIDVDYTRSLVWNEGTGWQLTTAGAANTTPSGFYWSANGYDHDGLGSSWTIVSNGTTYAYWYDANYDEVATASMTLPALSSTRVSDCMWQTWRNFPTKPDSAGPYPRYECSMMGSTGTANQYREGARSGGAMSPDGRFTAMPVTIVEDVYTLSEWAPCTPGTFWATTGDPTAEHPNLCRQQFVASRPLSAFLVISDSTTRSARTATGLALTERNLDWVAIAEDGHEIVLQSSSCTKSAEAQFQSCGAGLIEWRPLALVDGALGTPNFSAPLADVSQPSRLRGANLRALRDSDTSGSSDRSPSARALRERRDATMRMRRPRVG